MAHIAVCGANGGVLLKPHFPHRDQTTAAECYCNALESDVFPKIVGMLPEGEDFRRQQDLAIAHTAQNAKEFSETKNLTAMP